MIDIDDPPVICQTFFNIASQSAEEIDHIAVVTRRDVEGLCRSVS